MWRAPVGRIIGPTALGLPGAILCLYVFERGAIGGPTAILASAAIFACIAGILGLARRRFAAAAWEAGATLGPDAVSSEMHRRPLSRAAQAIRPAMLRLERDWREAARRSAARLAAAEAVIDAAPDPFILIDGQRRIVRSNPAAAAFVGPAGGPRDLGSALRNPLLLAATDAVLQGDAARSVEFALSVPAERVLRAQLARVDAPALDGAAAILSMHDVTELKRTDRLRADFVANAGHELKTPLATLIGFIETLLGPARDDPAARERFLGIMEQQARRMARLVDDLLSLSRIEINEHVAPTAPVALSAIVEEVARGLELSAAERGIRIVPDLPEGLPKVLGDADQLAQVFQNLLINAIKYGRPHSEIRVTGGVGTEDMQPHVRVSVADEGDGIAPEHLPRLTERFYRIDNARSRELGGTGLGLAIVKHIVNRHRGRLDISSALGHGSTFTVWLRPAPGMSSKRHPTVTPAQ